MTTDQNSPRPPIAIIGASALFPGSVDATGFWRDILAGKDLLSDVPPSHWLIEDYYDPNPSAPDKTYAKRGAFLKDVPFDPMGFGVPPSTVPATDTAQLLALIVAQKVLEDASNGDLGRIDRSRTSVILGVTSAQELLASMVGRLQRPVWVKALRESGIPESEVQAICDRISSNYVPWQEATFPGLLGNVVAGRIANRLDLGGTNCVTDAACASTFSAISMGINELYLGQSDLVISGGVDTMNDIFMYMCFSKTPALSPTGDCRPFSDQADGTMLGEGIGMVALKRLADAERDGDRVYAVLKGLGSSSDGKAKSVYAPLPQGQARALSRAYEIAGYSPRSVELMEAHGTGTKAGDAAEFEGLSSIFKQSQEAGPWCALGSVKSQIGHTKAAAGAAGLFKAVMALHHKVLPPTIKVDRPNPKLNLDASPFYLNTKTRPWVRGEEHPRRASVSSFGFGGSNFHLALEEYQGPNQAPRLLARSHELVVLSAASAAELSAQAKARAEEAKRPGALAWLAHTTQRGYSASAAHRLAVVADSDADLAAKLSDAAKRIETGPFALPGVYYAAGAALGSVAFLFPGQGSQSIGMGAELLQHFSVALEPWDHAADRGLHEVVYPRPGWGEAAEREQAAKLVRTEIAQPALGCMSASMLQLMRALKVEAQALAGHSFGEVSALYAAGAISEDDFLAVAEKRGQLMAEASAIPGAMTAVTTSKERIDALLKDLGLPVVIANHNDPNQVVLSGPTDAVEKVEKACAERKISARRLNVATAFHSPVVAASSAPFGAFLEKIAVSAPALPVYANGTAAPYPKDPGQIRRQLAGQIAEPVRFVEQIEAMYAAGIRVFVEVGAGTVLTNFVARILDGRPHAAIALDDKRGGVLGLMLALGKLVSAGAPVDFGALWAEHRIPEDPAGRAAPALTLDINGSNYQRPYPPKGGSAALPAPNPPRAEPAPQIVERVVERIVEVPVAAAPSNGHLAPSNGYAAPSNGHLAPSQAYAAPSDDWLRIFEETQRRTADAHSTYQRTMADSHTAFLAAMGAGLDQLAGTSQPATTRPMPMEQARPVAALPMAVAPRAMPAPAPMPALAPTAIAVPPAPVAPPKSAAAAPAAKPKAASPAAPSQNLGALLFEVVSEKTGYPAAMLKAEMDLEGDLGIDSIKRVEILSAMRERAPGLPEVEADKMAKLRTLGEILGHLSDGAPAPPASAVPAAAGVDLGALLFEVVAEKTGYPAAMLKAEMDLEGDLGIDSIKRVEILSAMRERAPGLPEVEADKMAKLRTLGEILGHLSDGAPGHRAPATAVPAAAGVDLGALLFEVVAEKTGYPAAMLKAEMDLEGDLGIDSIKRVEILSAMRERAPGLPEVEADKMAKLRTLGEILGHLSDGAPAPAPRAPATAVPTAAGVDLGALLFEVVAEKTGYPAAMLKAEMDLEGDLGIDSIKRVEILSAMRERAPGLPEVEADKMAKLRTLGEILGHLGGEQGKTETPRAAAAKVEAKASALGRWIVEPVEVPALRLAQPALYRARRIVISDDGGGVAAALIDALGKRGLKAELEGSGEGGDVFIHLGGLRSLKSPADAMAIEREALFSAQRFGRRAPKDGAFILVLDAGGDLGAGGTSGERAYLGGLFGLAKTAALEWPSCHVRAIDLERGGRTASQLAEALLDELLHGGPEVEVGLGRDGRRVTLRSRLAPPSSAKPVIDATSVVVVSGGARGVTAGAVIALAKAHRGRYALLGRTPLSEEPVSCRGKSEREVMAALAQEMVGATPKALRSKADEVLANREIRATLRAIEAAGGEARYVPVDVQSAPLVARALEPLRTSWGPITGLIHAAGVIEDRRIVDKTEAQVDRVLGTKVEGLNALLSATASDPLKLICLYSSISGRTGNIGQSDYAMGNEILNKVARSLAHQRPGCLVKSIGWGPWKGGMVTPAHEEVFKAQGVPLIPLEEGANMLVAELSSPEGVEVVLGASPVMKELVVHLLVSRGTHAYLEGHAIKGTPVVPVVLALEWFVRAARSFAPSLSLVRITDLKVVRGVRLERFEDGGHALAVRVRQISNGTGMTVRLELLGSGGELHYSADAQLAPVQEPPAAKPADPQVSAWGEQPIYGGVLFHGPKFQVIQAMDGVSDEGGAASLSGVKDQGWPTQGWRTDCAAMDGGLQLALLWSKQVLGCASLPTAIGAVRVYSDGPAVGPIRCVLLGRERQKERAISDVYFMGADGALLAELKGVETHALPGKS